MVALLLRTGPQHSPQHLVLNSQFASLSPELLSSVLHGFGGLTNSDLSIGIEHPIAEVRVASLKALHERREVTPATAERLWQDADATVRRAAVTVCSEFSRTLPEDEVRTILVWPNAKSSSMRSFSGGSSESDTKGLELYERFLRDNLRALTEDQLTRRINRSLSYDDEAYFVRAERYFARHGSRLRFDVDDRFHKYFEAVVERFKDSHQYISTNDLLSRFRDMEDFLRRKLTRMGLDILCRIGKREDLDRIRHNFQCRYAGRSIADVEFLRKRGNRTDISLLANADMLSLESTSWWTSDHDIFRKEVAKAMLKLSRGCSLSVLFSQDPPAPMLKAILLLCPDSRFSEISYRDFLRLLDNDDAEVRKVASLKAICVFSDQAN